MVALQTLLLYEVTLQHLSNHFMFEGLEFSHWDYSLFYQLSLGDGLFSQSIFICIYAYES